MTPQNLAVCFGPVLLPARQAPARPRIRGCGPGVTSAVDFKRHIEVLHYLLQSWPGEPAHGLGRQSRQAVMARPSRVSNQSVVKAGHAPIRVKPVSGCFSIRFRSNQSTIDATTGPTSKCANQKPGCLSNQFGPANEILIRAKALPPQRPKACLYVTSSKCSFCSLRSPQVSRGSGRCTILAAQTTALSALAASGPRGGNSSPRPGRPGEPPKQPLRW